MVRVSDLIAQFLKDREIDVVFGIIGSANSYMFDSINKLGYTKIVNVHHEQAAVLAMGAYYRTSGRISAAITTAGPGVVNSITGIVSNWADSIPGIIITGQEATRFLTGHANLRMQGIQGFDIAKMVADVTKSATTVYSGSSILNELEHAYVTSLSGRPGPTLVAVPFDVQSAMVDSRLTYIAPNKLAVKEDDVNYIGDAIKNAKRPVIIAGHGIRLSGAKEKFKQLVAKTNIPTILTWNGVDLLSHDNPNFFGKAGITGQRSSNFIVQNADLLLVLGSRLSLMQVGFDVKDFAPNAKVIVVDIDENEILKYSDRFDKLIVADVSDIISLLLNDDIGQLNIEKWTEQCNKWESKYPLVLKEHKHNGYINSYQFIDKLSGYLTDDHIIVTDMGTGLLSGFQSIKLKPEQTMFTSTGLGEMGYGLPASVGAGFARNGREVICLNCDGGMMFNLQELQTIKHYNLPIKIIVFSNDGYLMIKHTQKMLFKGDYVSTDTNSDLTLPDYSKLAVAFGYESYKLKDWEDFDDVIGEFLSSPNAAICEVFMDPEQDFIPKVKAVTANDGAIMPVPLEELSPLLPLDEIKEQMILGVCAKSLEIKR